MLNKFSPVLIHSFIPSNFILRLCKNIFQEDVIAVEKTATWPENARAVVVVAAAEDGAVVTEIICALNFIIIVAHHFGEHYKLYICPC